MHRNEFLTKCFSLKAEDIYKKRKISLDLSNNAYGILRAESEKHFDNPMVTAIPMEWFTEDGYDFQELADDIDNYFNNLKEPKRSLRELSQIVAKLEETR